MLTYMIWFLMDSSYKLIMHIQYPLDPGLKMLGHRLSIAMHITTGSNRTFFFLSSNCSRNVVLRVNDETHVNIGGALIYFPNSISFCMHRPLNISAIMRLDLTYIVLFQYFAAITKWYLQSQHKRNKTC